MTRFPAESSTDFAAGDRPGHGDDDNGRLGRAYSSASQQQLEVILEGESLVNDATALVALQFAVAALATGNFSPGRATLLFVWVAIRGARLACSSVSR
ncbi:MAG TPA: hypothetical protein VGQ82_00055 [Chthoniobacterales bacterium]|nr:hypothetical protein [Chthoniobacterales bacterium]